MPASLSGGMIKRVAVARAIITTPECLLYDEPTAGLDPIVTDSISFLIRRICKDKGITTVIVSHDMPSVIRIADKIVYLRNGEVYWTGTPEELLHSQDEILQNSCTGTPGKTGLPCPAKMKISNGFCWNGRNGNANNNHLATEP